jgi:hypothetical protein
MDRGEIVEALTALAGELDRRGVIAEMYVGGAAIALAFDERRATRDVDAVFEPKAVVYEAAATVAEEAGLSPGWLNDAVTVRLLADALDLSTTDEVLAVAEEAFGDRLEPAARFFVEELFAPK